MEEEQQTDTLESMTYKNHFTIVVQSIVSFLLIVAIFLFMGIMSRGEIRLDDPVYYTVAAVGVIGVYVSIRIWMKTTFTFGETEIVIKKDTFFKKETNIQYSRLASVNVRKNIINHLFGTTTLLFNVNSSINSNRAEATLTLESEEADRLREMVSARIFKKTMVVEEERHEETLVKVSNFDVILHGFFGQPTRTSIIGLASLGYSIATLFIGEGLSLVAILIFVLSSVIPWIRTILRYYNYRIYRKGDTITVESGLISNYRSSFHIKKVNSVRIREPLLARALGKSLLEAEVVGLADSEGLPLLCPLKEKKIVMDLAQTLVPEFLFDTDHNKQPKESFIPIMTNRLLWSVLFIALGLTLYFFVTLNYDLDKEIAFVRYSIYLIVALLAVVTPVVLIIHGLLAHRYREFDMGPETVLLITGAYDIQWEFIRYDKIQKCDVSSGLIQRRFGVGRCTVALMSSQGFRGITSGLFHRDELERIGNEVMDRIRDGRYDYRRYI